MLVLVEPVSIYLGDTKSLFEICILLVNYAIERFYFDDNMTLLLLFV